MEDKLSEEEDDILESEDEDEESEDEELFLDMGDPDDDELHTADSRLKRVNARRALEDYFEEKLLRDEGFDDFSTSSNDD